jgi:uncharacterized protein DUF6602
MNTAYHDLVLTRAQVAVDAARAVAGLRHQGLKGTLREIVVRDLLRPFLPADIGVGTGEIITYDNCHSRQLDVVIYDKRILPPILLEGAVGLFPIESALCTIEVKSTLTASELQASHESALELTGFTRTSGQYDERDKAISDVAMNVAPMLIAFGTDLAPDANSETERYDKLRGQGEPALRLICVVGRGCWYWMHGGGWGKWPQTNELEEVVGFVALIMNSYREIAATRKWPRIGMYLSR